MRHQCKRHTLGRAQDQRNAILRSLATDLFLYGEITTTISRAKALKPYAEKLISFAKKGDLHSRRIASRYIYSKETGEIMNMETKEILAYDRENKQYFNVETKEAVKELQKDKKYLNQTVLMKLFDRIGKQYQDRNGGYTRIYQLPPRRGDATKMAMIQLV